MESLQVHHLTEVALRVLINFERTSYQDHGKVPGKCDKRTVRHHSRCIPTVEENIGNGVLSVEGPLKDGMLKIL